LESFCEGERDLEGVKKNIKNMFEDDSDENKITISSIHKFKGMERDRVFRLESSFVCKPKTEYDQEQENNLHYVSITRAKNSLMLVE
jgi:superfamily I DNA/RNA helicase